MVLPLMRSRGNKIFTTSGSDVTELSIPAHYRCPVSLDLMKDPVTLTTGITYDRDSIEKWIDSGNRTCPVTNQALTSVDLIPNHALRRMIQSWCVLHRSHGVERIPTPRIPPAPAELSAVCLRLTQAAAKIDAKKCGDLVAKVKAWAAESERNRKCIAKSRVGFALSVSFEAFCVISSEGSGSALVEEILSLLTWTMDKEESRARLGTDASLRCLVSILRGNDLSARRNAVLVIKELLASGGEDATRIGESLLGIEGSLEGLIRMISEPICPRATKASLTAIYYLINKKDNFTMITTFIELGLVSLLLETVLESSDERGVCERAARLLDVICDAKEARDLARENAMTVPLVVKRILRVSDVATEFLVSVLWKVLVLEKNMDGVLAALEVGGFEKMLVMLQIGCGERLKEKVTGLLKLFNLHRRRLNCVNSSADFRYLKRSF